MNSGETTIEELITKLGNKFDSLRQVYVGTNGGDRWLAVGSEAPLNERIRLRALFVHEFGNTPVEALQNLINSI